MTINIGKLELELAKKIAATTDNQDLLALSTAVKKLKNNAVDYIDTYANIPAASTSNAGKMYYVSSEQAIYWSTGSENVAMTNSTGIRTLWAWGNNGSGQLGNSNITSYSSPVTTVGGGTAKWNAIASVNTASYALKTDGTLWSWGYNYYGQLGTGNLTSYSSPVTTAGGGTNWCQIAGGYGMSMSAVKTDGTLWVFGYNSCYGLGTGDTTTQSSPVTTAGGGNNWCYSAIAYHRTYGIKTDGTLWSAGNNAFGQLGTGNLTTYSSPVTTAGGGTTWKVVVGGYRHSVSIKTDGTLWGWGGNNIGQLGTGNLTTYSSPVTTAGGGTNWCQASAGGYFTGAVKTDGTLWMWGSGVYGQLGIGSAVSRSSPVTTAGGGTNWCQIAGGYTSAAAIKTDGTLWTWGCNSFGQLGTGNKTCYSSPVTISGGGTNWRQLSSGNNHVLALEVKAY